MFAADAVHYEVCLDGGMLMDEIWKTGPVGRELNGGIRRESGRVELGFCAV